MIKYAEVLNAWRNENRNMGKTAGLFDGIRNWWGYMRANTDSAFDSDEDISRKKYLRGKLKQYRQQGMSRGEAYRRAIDEDQAQHAQNISSAKAHYSAQGMDPKNIDRIVNDTYSKTPMNQAAADYAEKAKWTRDKDNAFKELGRTVGGSGRGM